MVNGSYYRWRILALAVLISAATLAASDHEGSFERTLKVTGPVELEVTTGSGNIEILSGDATSVQVQGAIRVNKRVSLDAAQQKIQALEDNPPIEQTGNYIRVGRIDDPALRRNVSISYVLVVPGETSLKSETGSGDQSIAGLKGPVKATTGSGNIRLSDANDDVRLHTGSGEIELSAVAGAVFAETGSGNIRASGVSGSIRAHTGSGEIRLEQVSADAVSVETGSGNVEVNGARRSLRAQTGSGSISVRGDPGGDWRLGTGSGNVTLRLSPQASFKLHAHTGSGSIKTSQPVTVEGKVTRSELRGVVRNGGSLVEVGTGSGDINIL